MRKLFSGILLTILFCSCNSGQNGKSTDVQYESRILKSLTNDWNRFNSSHDAQSLNAAYYDSVSLYGSKLTKAQAIARKEDFYKKHTDFKQSIGEITVSLTDEMRFKTSFQKHTTMDGKTSDVDGYLVFTKIGNDWKIFAESDDVTDKNIAKNKNKIVQGAEEYVLGDFDGNGKGDTLFYKMVEETNEVEHWNSIFLLRFSAPGLKPFKHQGDKNYIYVTNEGDLDGKPGDEFSIYAPPFAGCTYNMQAFYFVAGEVRPLIEMFMVPTACEEITNDGIAKRIFKENNTICYYTIDPNDESAIPKLIKAKAELIK